MIRRIVGKNIAVLGSDEFAAFRAGRPLLLDVGTGDGKHVLYEARRRPEWLVVGVDAAPAQLVKTSVSAARKPAKGGVANAIFVQAAAETLPAALAGASEIHVLMPWGSLLRGVLDGDAAVLERLRSAAVVGAELLVTLNLHAWRPPVPEVGAAAEPAPADVGGRLGAIYAAAGWTLTGAEYLDDDGIAALATSWGRRLNSSRTQFEVLALRAVAS